MFKKLILTLIVAVFAVALSACGSTTPQTWDGTWKADGFTATIKDQTIDIHIQGKDADALYWNGTFKPASSTIDSETITSDRNDATKKSMFGSQDSTKQFEYKDGTLHFHMSMMGVSRDVTLAKSSN